MGNLIDAFTKEDRIPVRFSELYTIIRQAAQAELMENAVACGVPHHYIQQMINGKNDLLEEYKSTGVLPEEIPAMQQTIEAYRNTGYTPEKVKELDALYLKKCEEVNALEKELWDSRTPANKEKNENE